MTNILHKKSIVFLTINHTKNPEQGALLQEIKNNFWLPEDQEEYLRFRT